MQSNAWAVLLRTFPPEQHNNLMLVVGGVEITVQDLLRIDHEHVAIRGRIAGSQDAGRLFIVPYQSIVYLGSQRSCKEADYHELFDQVQFPVAAAAPVSSERATAAVPDVAATSEPESAPAAVPEAVSPSSKTPVPIRSAVLERFRARANPGSSVSLPRPSDAPSSLAPPPADK